MELETTGEWPLQSGFWVADVAVRGLTLQRTVLGHPVSANLTAKDIGRLFLANRSGRDPALHFPPEFAFCPVSGERLTQATSLPKPTTWIPPFGALAVAEGTNSTAIGLQQSAINLRFASMEKYDEQADPDIRISMPPPGNYEFFSAQFGTIAAALIALDPQKGLVFAWLPASRKWIEIEHGGQLLLSESTINRAAWRAELAVGFHSKLYLSTQQGLACLTPDVPALNYQITYFGGAPALAAPVCFDGSVWAPVQAGTGQIQMVNLDEFDRAGISITLENTVGLGVASTPVAYGRVAIWACANGQLCLHKQIDGSVTASFIAWPAGITPQFQFGCPFQARDGALWQLCFNSGKGNYLYLKLGVRQAEMVDALAPRFCSGSVNYRFAAKLKSAPWDEPELGDDGASNEVVMPLIESTSSASVIGLKFNTTAGLADMLTSTERLRTQLIVDDGTSENCFHTVVVSEPWQMRFFVHEGTLWAYHPMLNRIAGWHLA